MGIFNSFGGKMKGRKIVLFGILRPLHNDKGRARGFLGSIILIE